jgi:hypothetical protein
MQVIFEISCSNSHYNTSGLPNLNFQMGYTRVRMGYNWGAILFIMGYIIGVHSLLSKIEGLVGKVEETTS